MIKTVSLPYFDSNISVRGPILKGNGRRYVNFIYKDNSRERHDITYAKYILSYYFKKTLTAEETVDHYNSDPTDDSLFNLRVLEWDQHLKEDVPSSANNGYVELKCVICKCSLNRKADTHAYNDAKRVKDVLLLCAFCKAEMFRKPARVNFDIKAGQKRFFCNKSHHHSYLKGIKNGTVEEVPEMELVVPEYYYNNK